MTDGRAQLAVTTGLLPPLPDGHARYRPHEHEASAEARPGWRNWHTQGP